MALPKENGDLKEKAKELAQRAVQPVQSKLEDVKQQVASKEGLKNIAFRAGGEDPTIAVTTGIALGIAGLGIGLGAKGLAKSFRGIKRLFVKEKPQESPQEEIANDIENMTDILENQSMSDLKVFDEVITLLEKILETNKEQLVVSEGILTKAQQERLEKKRNELQRLENENERIRQQETLLKELQSIKENNQVAPNDTPKQNIFGEVFKANFLNDILLNASGMLKKGLLAVFVQFPKILLTGLRFAIKTAFKTIAIVPIVLGAVNGIIEGIKEASKADTFLGGVKNLLFGFVSGFIETIANLFGFDVNAEMIRQKMDVMLGKIKDFVLGIFDFDASSIIESEFGKSIKAIGEKILNFFNQVFGNLSKTIIKTVRKIPTFEDFAMTDEEKKRLQTDKKRSELLDQRKELEQKEAEILQKPLGEGFFGIGDFTEQDRQAELRKIAIEKQKTDEQLRAITPPTIATPEKIGQNLGNLIANSEIVAKQQAQPIVNVTTPIVNNQTNQTNVQNSLIAPLSPKNNESSIDRAIQADF